MGTVENGIQFQCLLLGLNVPVYVAEHTKTVEDTATVGISWRKIFYARLD